MLLLFIRAAICESLVVQLEHALARARNEQRVREPGAVAVASRLVGYVESSLVMPVSMPHRLAAVVVPVDAAATAAHPPANAEHHEQGEQPAGVWCVVVVLRYLCHV